MISQFMYHFTPKYCNAIKYKNKILLNTNLKNLEHINIFDNIMYCKDLYGILYTIPIQNMI